MGVFFSLFFFLETVCRGVCRFYRSANERLGVSGFQVLVLWEGRWVTGLMNSDGRQLLINQETVCQRVHWNSSSYPNVCTQSCTSIHTSLKIRRRARQAAQRRPLPVHTHAHTHTHHSYLLHLGPMCLLLSRGQSCLSPPDSMSRMCLLPICSHHPPLGQAPRSIWKHLPDINSEWGPESKRCKRLRWGRWICIHSEGMIVTSYALSLCREKTLLLSPFCFPREPFISPSF